LLFIFNTIGSSPAGSISEKKKETAEDAQKRERKTKARRMMCHGASAHGAGAVEPPSGESTPSLGVEPQGTTAPHGTATTSQPKLMPVRRLAQRRGASQPTPSFPCHAIPLLCERCLLRHIS